MKIPQSWVRDLETAAAMVEAGRKFLQDTDRMMSTKSYASHLEKRGRRDGHRNASLQTGDEFGRITRSFQGFSQAEAASVKYFRAGPYESAPPLTNG
ncbi:MAG: hypothetical protein WCF20_12050 [Methylovirgula sp.]